MTTATGVEVDGDRAVVVKRCPAAGAGRLRREGERLRQASHPGVVQVVRSAPHGDGWELRTGHAGRALAAIVPGTVAAAAGVAAAVASTLADLHALGIVHGRLDASHVLIGDQGRPVLCGFGDGTGDARPEDDVAAVGRLLADRLGGDADLEPIPERRWRRRRAWAGWERRALLLLADQACAEPATARPTARRLAAAIAEAVPDVVPAASPGRPDDTGDGVDVAPAHLRAAATDRPRRSAPVAAAALAGAGCLLLVAAALGRRDGVDPPVQRVDAASPSTSAPEVVKHTARPVAGSVVSAGGNRYRVGQPGDQVLLGDWDCDGTATPALLRPGTGEVFVFEAWASDGPLVVEPVVQVPAADALVSEVSAGGCPSLVVRTVGGNVVPVVEPATA